MKKFYGMILGFAMIAAASATSPAIQPEGETVESAEVEVNLAQLTSKDVRVAGLATTAKVANVENGGASASTETFVTVFDPASEEIGDGGGSFKTFSLGHSDGGAKFLSAKFVKILPQLSRLTIEYTQRKFNPDSNSSADAYYNQKSKLSVDVEDGVFSETANVTKAAKSKAPPAKVKVPKKKK